MGLCGLTAVGRWRATLAVTLAVPGLALLSVACGGGAGTPTPEVTATMTPHAQPTIDGSTFNFPARGYASVIPDGWHANPNSLLVGPQQVDTFFSPDTVDGVQANISVSCEENPANVGTEQFVQNRLATLAKLGATDMKTLGTLTVAGVDAEKVAYTLTRDQKDIARVDVMFATPRCAWTIAVASAPSVASGSAAVLEEFLKSFKLLAGDATPTSGA